MFKLKEAILRHELKPKVVHRLPGRLRLRIPALKRIKHSEVDGTQYLGECLALSRGLEEVSVDARTGSILIHYRPDQLLETDILAYVDSLLGLMVKHREHILKLRREDWKRIGPRLKKAIGDATDQKLRLQQIEIPEDVWQ